jgi:predicted RNA-binding protein with PUA-like domain
MTTQYWLVKCEPHECSFDELKTREKQTGYWRGVRNYQARNLIRDQMAKKDLAFFYHSNCDEPGVAGIAEIVAAGYPDPSQFDKRDRYHDAKSKPEDPRWYSFDVKWKKKLKSFVSLADLKVHAGLGEMKVVQKGQRLSIQPVTAAEWKQVCKMGGITA